ncbi:type II secretion system protein N [Kangiella marina]|uniref:Type II secretion system protein N n=1 Tax=Kangiella marina TaxID=1079178 RepID=A0ABP8IHA2_9GAMM
MKKIILGSVAALIVFVILLVVMTPARVVTSWITDAVPGVQMGQVTGTIWNPAIEQVQYRNLTLRNIELETSLAPLMWGNLTTGITINDPNVKLTSQASLSSGRYELTDANIDIDTAYVIELIRTPLEGLSGQVTGIVSNAVFNDNKITQLNGEGTWSNAVIQYPNNNLELGDLRFKLSQMSNQGNGARVDIIDNDGVLDLKGFIEVGLDKQFNMRVHATNELPENLKQWLTRWGRQQDDRIYLEWQGRLP